MSKELAKTYDPKGIEDRLYKKWEDNGYFHAQADRSKKPFTIVMPPPNITGQLHMGHALDNTMQDILIRYKRMQGYNALWQPGTDHASIATEVKVIQSLKEQGINKADLTREEFLDKCWEWRKEYGGRIVKQLRKLGSSADWQRERFTMDEGCSHAVQEVFTKLYKKGWIYKGSRIVNWCPVCNTSISDAEVEYEEQAGHFWHIKYPLIEDDGSVSTTKFIEFATTRPETMLGDTAVAVNPDDDRYKDLIGKKLLLPIVNRELPVIADSYVDMEFGTGCVKCTPAHDPNDYEVGRRHNLAMPLCMNDDGTMNEMAGKYQGMDRFACREALINDLKESGLFDHLEKIVHSVGHSERTGVVVEPRLSKQWFVKMDVLARQVLENKEYEFVPERFNGTLKNWLTNIQDWCISRQLWWGHRIPAWYKNGETKVCEKSPGEGWTQDEDVLDTWFSSALWPFSTMGWPENTEMLKRYYPTDVLVTGYDIIFFWVSRMLFEGIEFTGHAPFKQILIHGLIRDPQGRKMSKSLGNGVDPFDVVEKYGCDSLRYFLNTNSSPGLDLRYDETKIESSWNYLNKVWNISRYVMMNIEGYHEVDLKHAKLNLASRWILARLNQVIKEVDYNFDKYEFGEGNKALYNFVWNDFASWYVEISKVDLQSDDAENKNITQNVLVYVLMQIIKMLHPIVPFITEEIYQSLPHKEESITISSWPTVEEAFNDEEAINSLNIVMEIISAVRNERAKASKAPSAKINIRLEAKSQEVCDILNSAKPYLLKFTNPNELVITIDKANLENQVVVVLNDLTIYIPTNDLVDIEEVIKKLEGELKKLEGELLRSNNMLNNPNFVNKAPEAKIQAERDKKAMYEEKYNEVKAHLASIKK